ncbi:MAG: hypothetical protein U5K72_10415 [Balneolaceae bacterium]|nr:hypothetical protein [Balneolaceae bacterium]
MEKSAKTNIDESVPKSIKGWNWGAFFLHGIWGLGNKTYIALLGFVPVINVPVMIYLGLKGNELAWQYKKWDSPEHFLSVQRNWNIAGMVAFAIYAVVVLWEFWDILSG